MITSKMIARAILCSIPVTLFGSYADAFNLDGAWTPDAANCNKAFIKTNNKIQISRASDAYGGGFVIDGNRIRGPLLTCKIDHRAEDGATLNLLATCETTAAPISPMQFSVRFDNDDKITRVFYNFPEISISYYRCKL
jgi:hypothetical protein